MPPGLRNCPWAFILPFHGWRQGHIADLLAKGAYCCTTGRMVMTAILIKLYAENPEMRKVDRIVEVLEKGGLVIYPTDTVYGICCDPLSQKAVEKMARLKGVKPHKADFSLICHSLSQVSDYVAQIDTPLYKVLKKTLPGPYTYIMKASSKVPKILHSNRKTVGIRIPDNQIALTLVERLGRPVLSMSVKDDDEIIAYTTDPELIYEDFGNRVDVVIDGGLGGNTPSTVVDCTAGVPTVVRLGAGNFDAFV